MTVRYRGRTFGWPMFPAHSCQKRQIDANTGYLGLDEKGGESSSEANRALAHRFHMDVFQRKDLAAADQTLSRDFVWHGGMGPGEVLRGPAAATPVATALSGALPDLNITHDDIVAEGDKVLIRWTARATHRGEFQGIAPTGKAVTVTGLTSSALWAARLSNCGRRRTDSGCCSNSASFPSRLERRAGRTVPCRSPKQTPRSIL